MRHVQFNYPESCVRVNVPDLVTLTAFLRARAMSNGARGFALATLNMDHVSRMRRDRGLRAVLAAQDLVLADGHPVVWLSRLAGRRVDLLPGADLVMPLAAWAGPQGVALVGADHVTLARAAARMEQAGVRVVLRLVAPMGLRADSAAAGDVLDTIRQSGAALCFLGLGVPLQERLALRGRGVAPNVGFISVGAGLDFLGGRRRRAPRWMRRVALEWLWRMGQEPRRLAPRYVRAVRALPPEALRALRLRIRRRG